MARKATNQTTQERQQPNDANAAVRVAQALHLRRMGYTYEAIAQRVGYGSRASAYKAIKRELAKMIHQEAQELAEHSMRLQLDRIDMALEKAVMPALAKGDLDAARTLVVLLKHQAELLGLYPKPGEDSDKGIKREYVGIDLDKITGLPARDPLRAAG